MTVPPAPIINCIPLPDGWYRVTARDPVNRTRFVEATMKDAGEAEAYVRGRFAEVWEEDHQHRTPHGAD